MSSAVMDSLPGVVISAPPKSMVLPSIERPPAPNDRFALLCVIDWVVVLSVVLL
ncbi:hypothetical protein D3C86_1919580 [compost metagenome]